MPKSYWELTNTEIERLGLDAPLNMSDGHARQPLDDVQVDLLADIRSLLTVQGTSHQRELESEMLAEYFDLTGQHRAQKLGRSFLSYSASDEISIAAQICRTQLKRVHLIDPVFDNIRYYLQDAGVDLIPLPESLLLEPARISLTGDGDEGLFVVLPNNPTGMELGEADFRALCIVCRDKRATLFVDASFRPLSKGVSWDMYAVLEDVGVEYFVIEDTGKSWPLHDLKVGIGTCSAGLFASVHERHDWLLLNVSPIILQMLTLVIRDSRLRGFWQTSGAPIARNRALVHAILQGLGLEHLGNCENVPLELYRLPAAAEPDTFFAACRKCGLELLPAKNYFWGEELGRDMFRIPLGRPTDEIVRCCDVIATALRAAR